MVILNATIYKNVFFCVCNYSVMYFWLGFIHPTRASTHLSQRCYEQVYKLHKPHAVESLLSLVLMLKSRWRQMGYKRFPECITASHTHFSSALSLTFIVVWSMRFKGVWLARITVVMIIAESPHAQAVHVSEAVLSWTYVAWLWTYFNATALKKSPVDFLNYLNVHWQ